MTPIDLHNRSLSSTVRRAASFVDRSSIGNNNYKLDTKEEISLFKKMIKQSCDYDFNLDTTSDEIDKQDLELKEIIRKKSESTRFFGLNCDFEDDLYKFMSDDAGSEGGEMVQKKLGGYTTDDDIKLVKRNIERLTEDYTPEINNKLITNFLKGYYNEKSWYQEGMFEQFGNENDGSKITNKEASAILKRILDAVPQDKRSDKNYEIVKEAYETYSNKEPEELFKDEQRFSLARAFGFSKLDNLDYAIEKLFDL